MITSDLLTKVRNEVQFGKIIAPITIDYDKNKCKKRVSLANTARYIFRVNHLHYRKRYDLCCLSAFQPITEFIFRVQQNRKLSINTSI